jgi:hypothetical protein
LELDFLSEKVFNNIYLKIITCKYMEQNKKKPESPFVPETLSFERPTPPEGMPIRESGEPFRPVTRDGFPAVSPEGMPIEGIEVVGQAPKKETPAYGTRRPDVATIQTRTESGVQNTTFGGQAELPADREPSTNPGLMPAVAGGVSQPPVQKDGSKVGIVGAGYQINRKEDKRDSTPTRPGIPAHSSSPTWPAPTETTAPQPTRGQLDTLKPPGISAKARQTAAQDIGLADAWLDETTGSGEREAYVPLPQFSMVEDNSGGKVSVADQPPVERATLAPGAGSYSAVAARTTPKKDTDDASKAEAAPATMRGASPFGDGDKAREIVFSNPIGLTKATPARGKYQEVKKSDTAYVFVNTDRPDNETGPETSRVAAHEAPVKPRGPGKDLLLPGKTFSTVMDESFLPDDKAVVTKPAAPQALRGGAQKTPGHEAPATVLPITGRETPGAKAAYERDRKPDGRYSSLTEATPSTVPQGKAAREAKAADAFLLNPNMSVREYNELLSKVDPMAGFHGPARPIQQPIAGEGRRPVTTVKVPRTRDERATFIVPPPKSFWESKVVEPVSKAWGWLKGKFSKNSNAIAFAGTVAAVTAAGGYVVKNYAFDQAAEQVSAPSAQLKTAPAPTASNVEVRTVKSFETTAPIIPVTPTKAPAPEINKPRTFSPTLTNSTDPVVQRIITKGEVKLGNNTVINTIIVPFKGLANGQQLKELQVLQKDVNLAMGVYFNEKFGTPEKLAKSLQDPRLRNLYATAKMAKEKGQWGSEHTAAKHPKAYALAEKILADSKVLGLDESSSSNTVVQNFARGNMFNAKVPGDVIKLQMSDGTFHIVPKIVFDIFEGKKVKGVLDENFKLMNSTPAAKQTGETGQFLQNMVQPNRQLATEQRLDNDMEIDNAWDEISAGHEKKIAEQTDLVKDFEKTKKVQIEFAPGLTTRQENEAIVPNVADKIASLYPQADGEKIRSLVKRFGFVGFKVVTRKSGGMTIELKKNFENILSPVLKKNIQPKKSTQEVFSV